MSINHLRADERTTLVEEALRLSVEVGVEGAAVLGGGLLLYFVVGGLLTNAMRARTPYPLFSIQSDPVLLSLGALVGVFTVQAAGSLLLYRFYAGDEDGSAASIALGLVAFGVGGGLLQMTLPAAWELLIHLV
ncbi:hypothetical protein [Halorubrum sp. Boch-26]|uniref:hypothetical protein n=1 Tax=Halorubrum sp. Boch-26 TaxID=2994426 RepID=UPI002468849A|nr:hypothetical protein [Halorubrum sp. Boch-26]